MDEEEIGSLLEELIREIFASYGNDQSKFGNND